jgi:hypothetical protein
MPSAPLPALGYRGVDHDTLPLGQFDSGR